MVNISLYMEKEDYESFVLKNCSFLIFSDVIKIGYRKQILTSKNNCLL